ncbi:Inner membrane protein yedI [Neisseria meningitidis]|nr:Inner membrane protein yedI [Neisseria meningitidis]
MAFASLFTLPDDITAVLDDVALMTKAAAKKTAGMVGDDLAPNANRVTGVSAERDCRLFGRWRKVLFPTSRFWYLRLCCFPPSCRNSLRRF